MRSPTRGLVVVGLCTATVTTATTVFAETYYVDVDSRGGACSDGHPGTSESAPWCTIAQADATLQAGDTVMIREGTYAEDIWPESSGTASARITYQAYPGETPVLTGVDYAIDIRSHSYITIDGIHARQTNRYVLVRDSDHVWIQNCVFTDANNEPPGWYTGIVIHQGSQYTWIHDNIIGGVGYCTDDDIGGVMAVGNWADPEENSHYNLIENNILFHGGHHVVEVASSFNVIRNNYFHNENWMDCARTETSGKCGNRNIGIGGDPPNVTRNLFEGNIIAHTGLPPDNDTSSGFSLRAIHTIVRRNVFHHCDGPGLAAAAMSDPQTNPNHSRIYHNTFSHNGYNAMSGLPDWMGTGLTVEHHGSGVTVEDVAIKNNIFHDNRTEAIIFYYVDEGLQTTADNWEHEGDPLFVDDESPPDPFDPAALDFHLTAASPCIDRGGFVTTTVGDGPGTEIAVEDAGYFTDGFGIVDGDLIQLEGQTERVRVVAVDYDQNILTVDQSISWTAGQGVGLPYQGQAPDQGAYEYGEAGTGGGGSGGTGGTGGAGGSAGTGGSAGAAGGGGAAGSPGAATSEEDSGCGCRLPGRRSGATWLGLALLAGLWRRRVKARRTRRGAWRPPLRRAG